MPPKKQESSSFGSATFGSATFGSSSFGSPSFGSVPSRKDDSNNSSNKNSINQFGTVKVSNAFSTGTETKLSSGNNPFMQNQNTGASNNPFMQNQNTDARNKSNTPSPQPPRPFSNFKQQDTKKEQNKSLIQGLPQKRDQQKNIDLQLETNKNAKVQQKILNKQQTLQIISKLQDHIPQNNQNLQTISIKFNKNQDIKQLIKQLIEQHQCLFQGKNYSNPILGQLFGEIIVYYEQQIQNRDNLLQNHFSRELKDLVHRQAGHHQSLQDKIQKYIRSYTKQKQKDQKKREHLMKKYDALLKKYRQLQNNLKTQIKLKVSEVQKNQKLIEQKKKLRQQKQNQHQKYIGCKRQAQSLTQQLQNSKYKLKQSAQTIEQLIKMKNAADMQFQKSIKQMAQQLNNNINHHRQKVENDNENQIKSLQNQVQMYKEWFKILVNDLSQRVTYKMSALITQQKWMQQYLKLTANKYQYRYKKQPNRQAIQRKCIPIGRNKQLLEQYTKKFNELQKQLKQS